jgi:acyl-CoA thioesterase FadM
VLESEIDELGHLSVPFYEQRAAESSEALLKQHGLDSSTLADQGVEPALVDTFTRNYREQFQGAALVVHGGVLDTDDGQIRLYHELVNSERDELSATFVHRFALQDVDSRARQAINARMAERLSSARVFWPEHGRPRSLDLARTPFQLTLEEAQTRNLAYSKPRTIQPEECNPAGFLFPARFQHLAYSGERLEDPSTAWMIETGTGLRLGLADLESRNTLFLLPRSGDRIQVFSADVELARKIIRRSHWVYDLDTGALLVAGSVVMVTLDLDARRSTEITPQVRAIFEQRYHPDLI